jgi:hypothetical protein
VDGAFDGSAPRPSGEREVPSGLYLRHVTGLRATGLEVRWGEVGGAWRHAVEIEECEDVALTGLEAEAPLVDGAGEALRSREVEGLRVSRLGGA